MRDWQAEDPAELVLAWEAVEDLLRVVPEGTARDVLRMVAAGVPVVGIAEELGLEAGDVQVIAARARIRILTAALPANEPDARPA